MVRIRRNQAITFTQRSISCLFQDKRAVSGKTRQYRVKKYWSSFFFFYQMGPLASCLNKRSGHSFTFKEVCPDKAYSGKPLMCFYAQDEWVNIAATLQGQILQFHESSRKSQYRLLKYDRDYLKVTLDSLLVFIFRGYFHFPKPCSTAPAVTVPQLEEMFHLHN